jgi:hypothetical protein
MYSYDCFNDLNLVETWKQESRQPGETSIGLIRFQINDKERMSKKVKIILNPFESEYSLQLGLQSIIYNFFINDSIKMKT